MKTAKEMFEELGYELYKDPEIEEEICFKNSEYGYFMCFDTETKMFYAYTNYWNDWVERYDFDIKTISAQELKAINKQVEELGWFDE